MKILIYQPRASYYVGGGEVVVINQAINLIKDGFDVCFVTSKASWILESEIFVKFKENFSNNIVQIEIPNNLKSIYDVNPGHDWVRWDLESLHFGLHARKIIESMTYDVGVCHLPLDLVALNDSRRNIVYLHGYPETLNYACELVLHRQHEYVAVSQKVKEEWSKLIKDREIESVCNGIDTKHFSPEVGKIKKHDILFVGRLVQNKGILNLLPTFKDLVLENSKIKIGIVGTGPLYEEIKSFINDNNLASNIEIYGYVLEGKLLELYRDSKIAVLPSLGKEGILTTALEATACGVPVITSQGLGLDEYIQNEKNGFLVNPDNQPEIKGLIKKILEDDNLLGNLSKQARDLSLDWDWSIKIKELERILKHE